MAVFVKLKEGKEFKDFKVGEKVEWLHPAAPSDDLFDVSIDGKEDKPAKKTKEEPKEESNKKLTENEIRELRKAEQIELLNKLGSEEIPKYEGDRVALILKLQ